MELLPNISHDDKTVEGLHVYAALCGCKQAKITPTLKDQYVGILPGSCFSCLV